MLTSHTTIEGEIFYPAARATLGQEEDLVDEALVEHASAKSLISQLQAMDGSEPLYNAKVRVLAEYIRHHLKEEEGEMFPKLRKAALDLTKLGRKMAARKAELAAAGMHAQEV